MGNEAFSGVRSFHEDGRSIANRIERRNRSTRRRIQKAQPADARAKAKAEGQAFRFPRPCRLTLNRRFGLAGQFGVGKALTGDLPYGQVEAVRVIHILAVVKAKALLIGVSLQVERFNANVSSLERPLKQRPEVFQSVRVYVVPNVHFGMVDELVNVTFLRQALVRLKRVAVDCRSLLYVSADVPANMVRTGVRQDLHPSLLRVAFKQAHHDGLTLESASTLLAHPKAGLFVQVHVEQLATYESFISFDFARELFFRSWVLECQPNAMQHVPRALLSDTQAAVKLPGANPVLHVGLHPDRNKPLVQTKRGVLHDGPDLHGELRFRMPRLTLPDAPGSDVGHVFRPAGRAHNAIRPATRYEVGNAVIGVGKVDDCILQSLWFACHRPIMRLEA